MARPTAGIVVALVTAVVCVTVLLTTGRAIRAEQDVVSRLDQMGTMLIAVSDNRGSAGIKASSVTTVNTLTGVDWAFGLGEAFDGHNSALPIDGTGVATRRFYGDVRSVVTLTSGRWPRAGEAITSVAGADALRLLQGIGGITVSEVTHRSYPVVGSYQSDPTLKSLANTVLVIPEPDSPLDEAVLYLYAKATQTQMVDPIVEAIPAVLTATAASAVTVESPQALREVREHIGQDLAANSRAVMLATIATGLILVTITMLAAVRDRKNDIGRRRALGASRSAIIVMVIVQAVLAALIGTVLGVFTGWVVNAATHAAPATVRFTLGLALLTTLSAMLAAAPPAILAARRDPVRILRVP
ncbi:MAG: ABC transporter permease [Propionibacteriaceae bacterium]|nr:ABC transporter permease [Propionibacteriaceae bacterium]